MELDSFQSDQKTRCFCAEMWERIRTDAKSCKEQPGALSGRRS